MQGYNPTAYTKIRLFRVTDAVEDKQGWRQTEMEAAGQRVDSIESHRADGDGGSWSESGQHRVT